MFRRFFWKKENATLLANKENSPIWIDSEYSCDSLMFLGWLWEMQSHHCVYVLKFFRTFFGLEFFFLFFWFIFVLGLVHFLFWCFFSFFSTSWIIIIDFLYYPIIFFQDAMYKLFTHWHNSKRFFAKSHHC